MAKLQESLTPESETRAIEQLSQSQSELARAIQGLQSTFVRPEDRPPVIDRKQLTTPEEADEYEAMIKHDFVRVDASGKPIDVNILYRPVHVFPRFKTSNPDEHVAYFSLRKWKWGKNQAGENVEVSLGEEWYEARKFKTDFKESVVPISAVQK